MYEMQRQITYSQVGVDLEVDMAELAHFFQDCSLFHSEAVGKGLAEVARNKRAWYLSSWQIEVERFPQYMEHVTVRTWPHDFKGMYGYRNFDILDEKGERIVRANAIWIFMDLERMRPTKATEEDIKGYDIEPALDMEYTPRKIKILDEAYKVRSVSPEPIVIRRSFLDSNHHVNNGRYVEEAMDYIPEGMVLKQMRVDYRKAATLGDKMYPAVYRDNGLVQVVFSDEENNPYVVVEVIGKE